MARKHNRDKSDAYLRWKIKKSYARIEPPPDGKKRLLKAAYQETIKSSSRFSYLNTMIEREDYQESQVYMAWVLSSRFTSTFLSTIKLR
jgi:hypothetical protein